MISLLNRKISVWIHAVSMMVVVLMIEILFNSHFLAWLIGFAFVGFLSQLAYVAPANRSARRFALASLLPGVAAVLVVMLFVSIS